MSESSRNFFKAMVDVGKIRRDVRFRGGTPAFLAANTPGVRVRCQPACKPGFVWRAVSRARWPFLWDGRCRPPRATNPGNDPETDPRIPQPRNALRRPYSVLLPVGLAMPLMLPCARCALTAPFHPCLAAVCFLWRFPWGCPRRKLSGTVSPWSPDFPPLRKRRPSGRLARAT